MKKSDFKNRVIKVVSQIPKGTVLSYGEVARVAGNPRAARVVGNIMKKNTDKKVPCHRVILSSGKIGGYNGLVGKKKKLLKQEGYKGII